MLFDLHIHSKYSRATGKDLDLKNLEKYAKIKGIDVLGTGDFTHPKWIEEIKTNLREDNGILYSKTNFPFLLQTEISLMYSQGGKGRRVHNIILAPSLETVKQINEALGKKGRLDYDGRPIFNISCIEFVDMMRKISEDIEIIPAHCLLGNSLVHTNYSIKKISEILVGDLVYTHNNKWQKVIKILSRKYSGLLYNIKPWCWTEGLEVTPEHPLYAIKSYKCSWIKGLCKKNCSKLSECKNKRFNDYLKEWVPAVELKKGDFLVYPRFNTIKTTRDFNNIKITKSLCRLIGYYLAEGYTIRDEGIGFSFNKNEKRYIDDVIYLIDNIFKKSKFTIDERKSKDIIFYSREINNFFKQFYNSSTRRAFSKRLPYFMLELPTSLQVEILNGWYRGDKGYTISRELINQMKIICLRLGIIPNIRVDLASKHKERGKHFIGNRVINANYDLYCLGNLSFFEDKFGLLNEEEFCRFKTKMVRRHGWIDKDYIYLPIRNINKRSYTGDVFNLDVEKDNSYVSEFASIHNCWTPWFGVFGSATGFDSLEEAFGDNVKYIHAIESGLSSDPEMNWRISKLDNINLLSFSDLHSYWPWRIGREATIFDVKLNYKAVLNAIRTGEGLKGTIEVDPSYGKYHWDGHRNCNIRIDPEKVKDKICPVCGKQLTIGVLRRVNELADREYGFRPKNAKEFKRIIPLSEIISNVISKGIATKGVWDVYNKLIQTFGNEMNILLKVSKDDLLKVVDNKLVNAILLNREGKIEFSPGYDGEYGVPLFDKQKKLGEF